MPKSYQKREKERLRRERAEAARAAAAASAGLPGKRKRRRLTDSLIGLSSAAILAVYGAGYMHTQRSDVHASAAALVFPTTPAQTAAPVIGQAPLVVTPTPVPGASGYRDGTYVAWGQSRHGDIEATVVIQGGKIVSAGISGCQTRYSCSYMNPLISRVVTNQKAPVEHVSGATDSSHAYTEAVKSALSQAV